MDPNELDVDIITRNDNGTARTGVYFAEKLENGAGYATYLENCGKQKEILINPLLPDKKRPEEFDLYREFMFSGEHSKICRSSCYDCLRDYYNQRNHSVMNWRLGFDLAKIAADSGFVPNIMDSQSYWYGAIKESVDLIGKIKRVKIPVRECTETIVFNVDGVEHFLVHPFWNADKRREVASGANVSDLGNYLFANEFITSLIYN
jgi:hypothetical protein